MSTGVHIRLLPFIDEKAPANFTHLVFAITQTQPEKTKRVKYPTTTRNIIV